MCGLGYHPAMADRPDPDEDRAFFRRHMAGVRRLKQDRAAPPAPGRRPVPLQRLRDDRAVMASLLSDDFDPTEIETGEELLYRRRGRFRLDAELDLHGRTVPEAREQLTAFLREARRHGWRCVRIVHGKGRSSAGQKPVLKGKVNGWLRQIDAVLGFCSARPPDGGTGAVCVLLKRG
jgi:DNA-nicking Smr family endonuclease